MGVFIILFTLVLCGFSTIGSNKYYNVLLYFFLCLIIGLRGISVGTDTLDYSRTFSNLTLSPNSWDSYVIFDPGFAYLCYFFKLCVSSNPLDCWGMMGIIYVLSYCAFMHKYTFESRYGVLIFVLYGTFFLGFNIIRQCFALSLVMLLYSYFDIRKTSVKQNIIIVVIILLISFFIHKTMLIFLIVPILSNERFLQCIDKRLLIFLIILTYVLFINNVVIDFVIQILDKLNFNGQIINYLSRVEYEASGYSVLKLTLVNAMLLYSIHKSSSVKNIFLLLSVCAVVFLNLFGSVVIELVRVYEALMTLGLIYYANLLSESSRVYKTIMIVLFSVLYWNIIIKGYGGITPYIFR